ncbi:hypothetical protein [Caldimonas tepidiphila]|uniref:hypothetical protein n=1 Tax=Caldimonas tepidiphila TaxID=2315841 RepID=UPI0013005287|nr:hypothetical protein [Caldimonas tepidiphila]
MSELDVIWIGNAPHAVLEWRPGPGGPVPAETLRLRTSHLHPLESEDGEGSEDEDEVQKWQYSAPVDEASKIVH